MSSEKVSQQLAAALQDSKTEGTVDVVLELSDPPQTAPASGERAQQIAARKEAFAKHAESVVGQIRSLGGEVTGQAWINSTLRARVSKAMVPALSAANQVKRLDIPHPIQADEPE